MISVEKPGSPLEILEHHGVKGMKWGVQKRVTQSSAFKSFSKASDKNVQRHFARKTARRERRKIPKKGIAPTRSSREFRAKYPTAKTQARAIRTARRESAAREKAIRKMRKTDSVEASRMLRDHMNNPGTAVAIRTTRGEKAVVGLIAGSFFAGSKPGSAGRDVPAYSTALAGAGILDRRRIEKKQRQGGFK